MRLTRKELANKYFGYHININYDNDKNILDYLNNLTEYLNAYDYLYDVNFTFVSRKKFVYDEIMEILNGEKIIDGNVLYFVLGSLEEFMCNPNFIYPNEFDGKELTELRRKNDIYENSGYISLEEKQYYDKIIASIKNYLSSTDINLDNIVNKMIEKIELLPVNIETSICQLLDKENLDRLSNDDLFKITSLFNQKCKEKNIVIDNSKYAGQLIGLPFNIPFIKK